MLGHGEAVPPIPPAILPKMGAHQSTLCTGASRALCNRARQREGSLSRSKLRRQCSLTKWVPLPLLLLLLLLLTR